MDAQQLLDYIIKPALKFMGGGYDSNNARMLLLATAAVESNCGHYIKQINGPALGIWEMEPSTHDDIWAECDALYGSLGQEVALLAGVDDALLRSFKTEADTMITNPMYSCVMARLKYAMAPSPLPEYKNGHMEYIWQYYKRIYNTDSGATTYRKFNQAWYDNGLDKVLL